MCYLPHQRRRPKGIILLVVLSMLTFFSLLIAAYLVFANQSRQASFAIANRNIKQPDPNSLLDDALMMLVRGTNDGTNPFFGEDLLSDHYGHDGEVLNVHHVDSFPAGPLRDPLESGFVRIPISQDGTNRAETLEIDDLYTGRLITFTSGPLTNRTYRIVRSIFEPAAGMVPAHDNVYFLMHGDEFGSQAPTVDLLRGLFYEDPTDLTLDGFSIWLNGIPRNGKPVGALDVAGRVSISASTVVDLVGEPDLTQPSDPDDASSAAVGFDLPIALQPNHLGTNVDKSLITGDFDEGYDAADHNNWFISHRRSDGTIIPSFHRPAVINYILNEIDWSGTIAADDYRNTVASFARATFRPIPIAPSQLGAGSPELNSRFSGGSSSFALRTPLRMSTSSHKARLDQLASALIDGQWDVDNDNDGTADSLWIDLGLPVILSPEGKLLRPLVAPLIEDLSGRLNVNAHGAYPVVFDDAGLDTANADWAGTGGAFGNAANDQFVFRGLGWGPAEIGIPVVPSSTMSAAEATAIRAVVSELMNYRYRNSDQATPLLEVPGQSGRDALDVIRYGYRPLKHTADGGFGYPTDPFGRGGFAIGRGGQIICAETATGVNIREDDTGTSSVVEPTVNECVNNPYELDPSGRLVGDRTFTLSDLEAVLRSREFDSDLLPNDLIAPLREIAALDSAFALQLANSLTTLSRSDDSPISYQQGTSAYKALVQLITLLIPQTDGIDNTPTTFLTSAQINALVPQEIRLGRKFDINRPFGNRIDDDVTSDGIIDEPNETEPATPYGVSSNGTGTVPTRYSATTGLTADFNFDSTVDARQLFARQLYTLMMLVTHDPDRPTITPVLPVTATTAGVTDFDPTLYRAMVIAQWAVNVVDYRDPDSIMTPFEYDPDPFLDGWGVDGDLTTNHSLRVRESGNNLDDDSDMNVDEVDEITISTGVAAGVVWGVESPELVMTETLATHDVRLQDTDTDTSGLTGNEAKRQPAGGPSNPGDPMDPHADQVRRPEGSLLIELYCPHETITATKSNEHTKPGFPQELYTSDGQLDLGAVSPSGAPVWRIAISEPHSNEPTAAPDVVATAFPDLASYDPNEPLVHGTPGATLALERFIWFNSNRVNSGPQASVVTGTDSSDYADPAAINSVITANSFADLTDPNSVFVAKDSANGGGTRLLSPGQYLVIGPRETTFLGSRSDGSGKSLYPSRQRIDLLSGTATLWKNANGNVNPPTQVRTSPAFGASAYHAAPSRLIVGSFLPTGWSANSFTHGVPGLSVSEPLSNSYYTSIPANHYRQGAAMAPLDEDGFAGADYPLLDAYLDLEDTSTTSAIDVPLDNGTGILPNNGTEPILGTIDRFCSAFLQRLADPTRAYHPVTNPYRTVDWMAIDLTVFNGEAAPSDIEQGGASYAHRSRQKTGNGVNSLFSYSTNQGEFTGGGAASVGNASLTELDFFHFTTAERFLYSSLGFLNTDTSTEADYSTLPDLTQRGHSNLSFAGFENSLGTPPIIPGSPPTIGASTTTVTGFDRNQPQIPFVRHSWLNRPFATVAEITLVPSCAQGQLFQAYTFSPSADAAVYPAKGANVDAAIGRAPFGHLLNFFGSSDNAGSPTEFCRIFDLVHTLPRFANELDYFNPSNAIPGSMSDVSDAYPPPFGFVYDNQRLGSINLNAISNHYVWAGLMQAHLNPAEFSSSDGGGGATPTQLSFDAFEESRRGYAIPSTATDEDIMTGTRPYTYDADHISGIFPSEFAGVFQNATNARLGIASLQPATGAADRMVRRPVDGTLFRSNGPLFSSTTVPQFVRAVSEEPLITSAHQNRTDNAFMRYQTLMRMPNLTSNNSQVFLIRLTLGLFEVDASNTSSFGTEYGEDSGRVQRYKAMFIVDRSVPVGFMPGQDLNARDTVIFERFYQ